MAINCLANRECPKEESCAEPQKRKVKRLTVVAKPREGFGETPKLAIGKPLNRNTGAVLQNSKT